MATFVLIHAAATDSSCWGPLAAELHGRGHSVVAVDLPVEDSSAGLEDYVAVVLDAVGHGGETVVVGHSFGGFTAPIVALRLRAKLLVMLQAQIPTPGEKPGDWWENTGYAEARALQDQIDGRDPQDPVDPLEVMLHDTPDSLATELLGRQREQSETPFLQPWPLERWTMIPTRVLLARDDRFFPLDFMRHISRGRLGIEPDVMPGDHCPMLGHPKEVADWLECYWEAVRTT